MSKRKCPWCYRLLQFRSDGRLRKHRYKPTTWSKSDECGGSEATLKSDGSWHTKWCECDECRPMATAEQCKARAKRDQCR